MGWKDVPMPPQVAALHRDRRGFPVPWISDWDSGEVDALGHHWHIQDKDAQSKVWGPYLESCAHIDGVGEPNLGALCAPRQLHGMLQRLCDVCGKKVGKTAFFMGNKELHERGYRELPLHLDCVLYSGQVCPGMVTKAEGTIWISITEDYSCNMVRKYRDGDREFVGMDDHRWITMQELGVLSIFVGVTAVPVEGPRSRHLSLEDFLHEHGLEHPYRKRARA